MKDPRPNRLHGPATIYWLVTGLALLVRTVHIAQFSDPALNPTFTVPAGDPAVHHRWALDLVAGLWPGPEPYFRAPLYPYFLGLLYRAFGAESPLLVQLAHALVSALGAGFAALAAGRIWHRTAAWAAGLLFALLWPSIFFAGELLAVTLSVTLNLALLWLLLTDAPPRRLLLIGLVWGLSAIARPTILVIAPVVIWYLWRRGTLTAKNRLPGWAWLGLGLVLTIGPVTLRNFVRGGEPVLIAASGGVNFYIGNNEHADGRVAFLPGAPAEWQGEMSDALQLARAETGRALTAQQTDQYFWRQGLRFWATQPAKALALTTRKAWLLIADGERSNNKNLAFWRARSPLLRWPVWPGWGLVLGLAILGLASPDTPRLSRRLILGLAVSYAAALLLFFINARFRLPLLAWLVIPAGGGIAILWQAWRARSLVRVPLRWAAVALAISLLVTVPDALTYKQDPDTDFESWRSLGNSFLAAGNANGAIAAWEKALRIDGKQALDAHRWTLPRVYQPLAQIYERQGRQDLAQSVYQRWQKRLPGSSAAVMGEANLLLQTGRPERAGELLASVLADHPQNEDARLGYAWALQKSGAAAEAMVQFRLVQPGKASPSASLGVARCLSALGRNDEAENELRRLIRTQPGFAVAYEDLAALYARTDRPAAEKQVWQALLQRQPGHQLARRQLARLR